MEKRGQERGVRKRRERLIGGKERTRRTGLGGGMRKRMTMEKEG